MLRAFSSEAANAADGNVKTAWNAVRGPSVIYVSRDSVPADAKKQCTGQSGELDQVILWCNADPSCNFLYGLETGRETRWLTCSSVAETSTISKNARLAKIKSKTVVNYEEVVGSGGCGGNGENWLNMYQGPRACSTLCKSKGKMAFTVVTGGDNNCKCSDKCTPENRGDFKGYLVGSVIKTLVVSSKEQATDSWLDLFFAWPSDTSALKIKWGVAFCKYRILWRSSDKGMWITHANNLVPSSTTGQDVVELKLQVVKEVRIQGIEFCSEFQGKSGLVSASIVEATAVPVEGAELRTATAADCRKQCQKSATCTDYSWEGSSAKLRRVMTQSSTAWGGKPERAMDGNTNSNYNGNSCSHTAGSEERAFWQVDMGGPVVIESVRLTNRNAYLGNFDNEHGITLLVDGIACAKDVLIGVGATVDVPCKVGRGQVIRIQPKSYDVPGKRGKLVICEVDVLPGTAIAPAGYQGACQLGRDGSYNPTRMAGYVAAPCEPNATLGNVSTNTDVLVANPAAFLFTISGRLRSTDAWSVLSTPTRKYGSPSTIVGKGQLTNTRVRQLKLTLPQGTGVVQVLAEGREVIPPGWGVVEKVLEEGQALSLQFNAFDDCVSKCEEQGLGCNSFTRCGDTCWLKNNHEVGAFLDLKLSGDRNCKTWYKTDSQFWWLKKIGPVPTGGGKTTVDEPQCNPGFFSVSKTIGQQKVSQSSVAYGGAPQRAVDGQLGQSITICNLAPVFQNIAHNRDVRCVLHPSTLRSRCWVKPPPRTE